MLLASREIPKTNPIVFSPWEPASEGQKPLRALRGFVVQIFSPDADEIRKTNPIPAQKRGNVQECSVARGDRNGTEMVQFRYGMVWLWCGYEVVFRRAVSTRYAIRARVLADALEVATLTMAREGSRSEGD